MMKRAVVLFVGLALALPAAAWAQGKTDFSGTWVFNSAKSEPPPGGGGGGVAVGRGAVVTAALAALTTLRVKQTATELTIENEASYKLDGSESVNKVPNGQAKTKASWDGAKLVLSSTQSLSSIAGQFDIQTKDVWSLDAGTLTIERTSNTSAPGASSTRKLVYTKKP